MSRRSVSGCWAAILSMLVAAPEFAVSQAFELERLVGGLQRPLLVTQAGDGSGRLYIVEQGGTVRIYESGRLLSEPFLDISSQLSGGNEQGLLGLAFHPDFEENGFLFVNYTDRSGDTVVARFAVASNPDRVDPGSETEVLTIDQPFSNHNGGHLAFGPDGYLYISSGDGGDAGDPQNNGQSLDTLLGKILRIDVDGLPFAIPADNPFVSNAAAMDEIWAYGLRNPWRFSFDRRTGDLFIGDVGQNAQEEIDFQPSRSGGGENYGWRRLEGNRCFNPSTNCDQPGLTPPILIYGHGLGCSVTGGFRYRGKRSPGLKGVYLFGDFCSGRIWGAERTGGGWTATELLDSDLAISSFGEDRNGELFVVDLQGSVYRLASTILLLDGFDSGSTNAWSSAKGRVEVIEPGLDGSSHALAASIGSNGVKSFVLTKKPKKAASLRVEFLLNPNGADLAGKRVDILHLAKGRKAHAKLKLERDGSRYRVLLLVREDGAGLLEVGSVRISANSVSRLGIEWQRASSTAAADGVARLVRGERVRAERTDLDNRNSVVKTVKAGLPAGSPVAGSGRVLFDSYLIRR